MSLPTEKTPPATGMNNRNLLIYGSQKVGKSTLAAGLRPDSTIFLATEPGLSAIEAFVERISNWTQFLSKCAELAAGGHTFDTVVIDTVDELARMCSDHVVAGLAASEGLDTSKYIHSNDFAYGKGSDAIAQEFRLKISKLCNLGFTVIFISHTKEMMVKDRTGLESTRYTPDVGQTKQRKWLLGFVDLIAYAAIGNDEIDGEIRYLRFKGDSSVESGGRISRDKLELLPETINLEAADVMACFENVWGGPVKNHQPEANIVPVPA